MRKNTHKFLVYLSCLIMADYVRLDTAITISAVNCIPRTKAGPELIAPVSYNGCEGPEKLRYLYKSEKRVIAWPDGYEEEVSASSKGQCDYYYPNPCSSSRDMLRSSGR